MYRALVYACRAKAAEELADMVAASPRAELLRVEATCVSARLQRALSTGAADMALIDVDARPYGVDGVSLVRHCLRRGAETQVIYVGGEGSFRSEVYETEHVWFLLRPLRQGELDAAVGRAIDNLERRRARPVMVRSAGGVEHAVWPRSVSHVESDGHLLLIHVGDKVLKAYGKKSDFVDMLPSDFVQCHRSHVVNLGCVDALGSEGVRLTSGETVPLGRTFRPAVRRAFERHVGRGFAGRVSG